MIVPSKFVTYKESSLSKFPAVLKRLEKIDLPVLRLYEGVKTDTRDKSLSISEFLDILDCLFVLRKIDIIGEHIHRVD